MYKYKVLSDNVQRGRPTNPLAAGTNCHTVRTYRIEERFQINTRNMWALIVTNLNETMKFVKRPKNCVLKVHFVFFHIPLVSMETRSKVAIFEILRKNRYHSSCTIYIYKLCDKVNGFDILYTESNG